MIRTGSGDRRRIVLVRLLHLFFERRQARCLGSHAPKKKKEGEWRGHRSISNSCHVGGPCARVPGLLPVLELGGIG